MGRPHRNVISGVYVIKVSRQGVEHLYVGSSKNIVRRWYSHIDQLRSRRHHNFNLQNAWDEFGEASFRFEILEETANYVSAEQEWIDKLKPDFNLADAVASQAGHTYGGPREKSIMNMPEAPLWGDPMTIAISEPDAIYPNEFDMYSSEEIYSGTYVLLSDSDRALRRALSYDTLVFRS